MNVTGEFDKAEKNQGSDGIAQDHQQDVDQETDAPNTRESEIEHVGDAVLGPRHDESRNAEDKTGCLDEPVVRFLPNIDREEDEDPTEDPHDQRLIPGLRSIP